MSGGLREELVWGFQMKCVRAKKWIKIIFGIAGLFIVIGLISGLVTIRFLSFSVTTEGVVISHVEIKRDDEAPTYAIVFTYEDEAGG